MFSYRSSLLANERYRWYALGLTTWGQAATNILGSAFGPLAPFLQDDLHISRASVGLISTAVFLTALRRGEAFANQIYTSPPTSSQMLRPYRTTAGIVARGR